MHVCMMHISMILDPDTCIYLCSLILDSSMYDAHMVHASMVTNGWTNKAILGVGLSGGQKSGKHNLWLLPKIYLVGGDDKMVTQKKSLWSNKVGF